jgi:hypothetical protein
MERLSYRKGGAHGPHARLRPHAGNAPAIASAVAHVAPRSAPMRRSPAPEREPLAEVAGPVCAAVATPLAPFDDRRLKEAQLWRSLLDGQPELVDKLGDLLGRHPEQRGDLGDGSGSGLDLHAGSIGKRPRRPHSGGQPDEDGAAAARPGLRADVRRDPA